MRIKLLVFLVGMMLLGASGVRAAQVTLDNLRYSLSDDGNLTAELTICYELTSPALVIPDYVTYEGEEYKVISIGKSVFYYSNLTSVMLPSGLTSIGGGAFEGCRGLTSVMLPSGLTSIGGGAFEGCRGLTSVTLPSGLTSIGGATFRDCSGLTSVTLPSGLTSIESGAFEGCRGLTSVTLPSGLTSIGSSAFKGCRGLTSLTLSSGLTSIHDSAFRSCDGLMSIRCAAHVPPSIYASTFDQSLYAKSLYIPVGSEAAYMAVNDWGKFRYIIEDADLGAIERLNGLTYHLSVAEDANLTAKVASFDNTSTSVIIPDCVIYGEKEYAVVGVKPSAFWGCSSLTSLTLPSGLTSIGEFAFGNCDGLMSVYCAALIPPIIESNTFDPTDKPLYIPVGSKSAYLAADYWKDFNNIIEDAGLSIAEHNQSNLISYTDGIITLSDSEMPAQVEVYTSNGKQVATTWVASGGSCDLNNLPSGLYIVKVKAGDKIMSRKIVK